MDTKQFKKYSQTSDKSSSENSQSDQFVFGEDQPKTIKIRQVQSNKKLNNYLQTQPNIKFNCNKPAKELLYNENQSKLRKNQGIRSQKRKTQIYDEDQNKSKQNFNYYQYDACSCGKNSQELCPDSFKLNQRDQGFRGSKTGNNKIQFKSNYKQKIQNIFENNIYKNDDHKQKKQTSQNGQRYLQGTTEEKQYFKNNDQQDINYSHQNTHYDKKIEPKSQNSLLQNSWNSQNCKSQLDQVHPRMQMNNLQTENSQQKDEQDRSDQDKQMKAEQLEKPSIEQEQEILISYSIPSVVDHYSHSQEILEDQFLINALNPLNSSNNLQNTFDQSNQDNQSKDQNSEDLFSDKELDVLNQFFQIISVENQDVFVQLRIETENVAEYKIKQISNKFYKFCETPSNLKTNPFISIINSEKKVPRDPQPRFNETNNRLNNDKINKKVSQLTLAKIKNPHCILKHKNEIGQKLNGQKQKLVLKKLEKYRQSSANDLLQLKIEQVTLKCSICNNNKSFLYEQMINHQCHAKCANVLRFNIKKISVTQSKI